jgi:hypothetical protein
MLHDCRNKGLDPVTSGQLSREEIERGEANPGYRLKVLSARHTTPVVRTRRGPRYTPLSRRQDRPNAIAWIVRYHPELTDAQISKLVGTTKATIHSIRDRDHWNMANIKPVDPVTLPKPLRKSPDFGVEVDAMPGGFVCSASLKGLVAGDAIRKTAFGTRPIRKLFSKPQRAFYEQHAPAGLALDDLSVMGPILVLKIKWLPEELPNKMVAELWTYPDGSLILELSTKCAPADLISTIDDTRAYLFFTSLDGHLWRMWAPLAQFPRGFDHCEQALRADIFEASHTYRLLGQNRYLTLLQQKITE